MQCSVGGVCVFLMIAAWLTWLLTTASSAQRAYRVEYEQLVRTLAETSKGIPFPQTDAAATTWCAAPAVAARVPAAGKTNGGGGLAHIFDSACTVPIVLYAWNRPAYLERMLRSLQELNAHVMAMPGWPAEVPALRVIVSLDGANPEVVRVVQRAHAAGVPILRLMIYPVASFHPYGGGSLDNLKNHWLWMLEQVYDRIPEFQAHMSDIMFLEDDMYLAHDALHMFRLLSYLRYTQCDDCWGGAISMSGFSKGAAANTSIVIQDGHSNHGYFFNRTVWHALKREVEHFVTFPDGWDWAFIHMTRIGVVPPRFVAPALSRVRNFGEVGITVTKSYYKDAGLGTSPTSSLTAAEFVRLAAQDALHVTDRHTFSQPEVGAGTLDDTQSRCPACVWEERQRRRHPKVA
ncbi:hypothetical protein EON62_02370 [archaeon]|nr:MAG: hypothetical protein EON62_02370 [archaeon]